jgi:hypothetical protein
MARPSSLSNTANGIDADTLTGVTTPKGQANNPSPGIA